MAERDPLIAPIKGDSVRRRDGKVMTVLKGGRKVTYSLDPNPSGTNRYETWCWKDKARGGEVVKRAEAK